MGRGQEARREGGGRALSAPSTPLRGAAVFSSLLAVLHAPCHRARSMYRVYLICRGFLDPPSPFVCIFCWCIRTFLGTHIIKHYFSQGFDYDSRNSEYVLRRFLTYPNRSLAASGRKGCKLSLQHTMSYCTTLFSR